jgi:integrase
VRHTVFANIGRRAKPEFQVKKSSVSNGGLSWFIIGRPNGERIRAWFPTKEKAQAEATERNTKMRRLGEESVTVDNSLIAMAREGSDLLKPFGKNLRDAVIFYLGHLNRLSSSVPFSALATQVRSEFKRRKQANEVSDRHAESLKETLKKLEARFGSQLVSEIQTNDMREWLTTMPLATTTRNKHRGYASQIFNLAIEYGYATVNPVAKIKSFNERSTEENGEIAILSADETARLFASADKSVIPFLTLSFFCGIRRATLERLDWSDVKFDEKRVIVPAYKGKKQKRYPVELSENALAWLRPHVRESGSLLVPSRSINRFSTEMGRPSVTGTRRLICKAAQLAGVNLPDNAGRHTFISMHVAHFENVAKTAKEANNSPRIIETNYLHIVRKEDAAKYWSIVPA